MHKLDFQVKDKLCVVNVTFYHQALGQHQAWQGEALSLEVVQEGGPRKGVRDGHSKPCFLGPPVPCCPAWSKQETYRTTGQCPKPLSPITSHRGAQHKLPLCCFKEHLTEDMKRAPHAPAGRARP